MTNLRREHFKGLLYEDTIHNYRQALICYNNVGKLWKSLKEPEKLKKVEIIFESLLFRIGICHKEMRNYNLAIKYFEKVFTQCEGQDKAIFEKRIRFDALQKTEFCWYSMKRYDEAFDTAVLIIDEYEQNRTYQADEDLTETYNLIQNNICHLIEKKYNFQPHPKDHPELMTKDPEGIIRLKQAQRLFNKGEMKLKKEDWAGTFTFMRDCLAVKRRVYRDGNIPRKEYTYIVNVMISSLKKLGRFEEALEYSSSVINVWKCIEDRWLRLFPKSLNNLAMTYQEAAEMYEAFQYHEEALHCHKRTLELINPDQQFELQENEGKPLYSYGKINYLVGNYDVALRCFARFDGVCQRILAQMLPQCHEYVAMAYEKQKKHGKALDILKESQLPKTYLYYKCLANCQAKTSKKDLALMNYLKAIDTLNIEQTDDFTFSENPDVHAIFVLMKNYGLTLPDTHKYDHNEFWTSTEGLQVLWESLVALKDRQSATSYLKICRNAKTKLSSKIPFVKKEKKNLERFYNSVELVDFFQRLRQ